MLKLAPALIAGLTTMGGWAVVTVKEVPEYFVAGQSYTLEFQVRQHGRTLPQWIAAAPRAAHVPTGHRHDCRGPEIGRGHVCRHLYRTGLGRPRFSDDSKRIQGRTAASLPSHGGRCWSRASLHVADRARAGGVCR